MIAEIGVDMTRFATRGHLAWWARTEAAVRDFQALVGLPVDGIVGPMTWVALTDDGT